MLVRTICRISSKNSRFETAAFLKWAPLDSTGGAMDDQRPEDETRPAAFPLHSAMPCVCVADAGQQMRTFLTETLEDLGRVTCECVDIADLSGTLDSRLLDLVLIGSSEGGIKACEMVELLAVREFGGKVLVLGPRASPMVAAIQELGAKLGLAMLPLLPTPFG